MFSCCSCALSIGVADIVDIITPACMAVNIVRACRILHYLYSVNMRVLNGSHVTCAMLCTLIKGLRAAI